jgi:hypothetical protein
MMHCMTMHMPLGASRWVIVVNLALAFHAISAAQVTGDFNGDGFADLAVGVPLEDVNGHADAGAVAIIYGSAQRLSADAALDDQVWHQDKTGVPEAADNGDLFGRALAAGNFNLDGFDDLAIGAPGEEVGSDNSAGTVTVLYGSAAGLTADDAQLWHQDVSGISDGAEPGDGFGSSLAAGDFNNDGAADLAIGVPSETLGTNVEAGGVAVLYGTLAGLAATGDQFFTQNTEGVANSAESFDRFGEVLAAGDFNGDGRDELAIGVPDEEVNDRSEAGCVHILYGSGPGLTVGGSQFWTQVSEGIADNIEDDDGFGAALAAGDFDHDGIEDLAIGVPEEDVGSIVDAGGVHVLYGRDGGLRASASQLWHQNVSGVPDGLETSDRFGQSLAAGDFDIDGFADLAIGVSSEGIGNTSQAGAVIVLYGSAARLAATGAQMWHQDIEAILDKCEAEDHFGATLCTGDFDDDGRTDLAVGVPNENVPVAEAGAVHVIYGSGDGLRAGPDQFWHQDSPGINDQAEPDDEFGSGNRD